MTINTFGEINMINFDVSSDSTCDLYKDYIEKRHIWFAPLTFTLDKDGKQEEGVDEFSSTFIRKWREGRFPARRCSIIRRTWSISEKWLPRA